MKVAQMNCHLRGYIFCFCCLLLHLVPNSRGFLWICSDQVSVFQEFGSQTNFSILIAVFLTSSETLKASLDEFPQNGDFFSNCNLFGVRPFLLNFWEQLRRAVCPKWTPNQIRVGRLQGKCFLFECLPTKFQSLRGRLNKWRTTYVNNL